MEIQSLEVFVCVYIGKIEKSCCCHAVVTDSGESSLTLCACIESVHDFVCGVMSVAVCEAGTGSAISHWILSQCPDTGALLTCEGNGEGCCFKPVTVSYPQTPHYTSLRCPSTYFSI